MNLNAASLLGLRHVPVVFRDLAAAIEHAAMCVKPQRVMLAEGVCWIVCPADAAKLESSGYEYAV